jgi:hypothetical protein
MTETIESSRISGPMENSMKRRRKSTPFTPRSMMRLRPPVLRVM